MIYKGATVTQSLQLASGDVVDGLDRSTFPDLPYALPPLPWTPADVTLPPDVTLALTDVEQIPELADLASKAAVFHRPTFWPYILGETDATSIEDYLDRYEVGGAPAPQGNRLYAGLVSDQANRGVTGYMNQFQPEVADGSFSLLEFTVGCPAIHPTEIVGVVLSVDKANVGGRNQQGVYDGLPRLHVEYASSKSGQMKYRWDTLDGAFRVYNVSVVRPGQIQARRPRRRKPTLLSRPQSRQNTNSHQRLQRICRRLPSTMSNSGGLNSLHSTKPSWMLALREPGTRRCPSAAARRTPNAATGSAIEGAAPRYGPARITEGLVKRAMTAAPVPALTGAAGPARRRQIATSSAVETSANPR